MSEISLVIKTPGSSDDLRESFPRHTVVEQVKAWIWLTHTAQPTPESQKLIFAGQVLDTSTNLESVFAERGDGPHTVHLIITKKAPSPSSPAPAASPKASMPKPTTPSSTSDSTGAMTPDFFQQMMQQARAAQQQQQQQMYASPHAYYSPQQMAIYQQQMAAYQQEYAKWYQQMLVYQQAQAAAGHSPQFTSSPSPAVPYTPPPVQAGAGLQAPLGGGVGSPAAQVPVYDIDPPGINQGADDIPPVPPAVPAAPPVDGAAAANANNVDGGPPAPAAPTFLQALRRAFSPSLVVKFLFLVAVLHQDIGTRRTVVLIVAAAIFAFLRTVIIWSRGVIRAEQAQVAARIPEVGPEGAEGGAGGDGEAGGGDGAQQHTHTHEEIMAARARGWPRSGLGVVTGMMAGFFYSLFPAWDPPDLRPLPPPPPPTPPVEPAGGDGADAGLGGENNEQPGAPAVMAGGD